jgi:hypothetical protein
MGVSYQLLMLDFSGNMSEKGGFFGKNPQNQEYFCQINQLISVKIFKEKTLIKKKVVIYQS